MLSLELAQQLKNNGLTWQPRYHDFFMIPDTSLSDRAFVLTDMMASIEVLKGWPAITFNGAVEWALDYVLMQDAIWLPTEAQLRAEIEQRIAAGAGLALVRDRDGYRVEVTTADEPLVFRAATATDAYGQALLAILTLADTNEPPAA